MKVRTVGLTLVLALGILAAPLAAEAQAPQKIARIGVLAVGALGGPASATLEALRQGLADFGYVEGQNVAFVVRFAEGKIDRLPDLALELVRLKVDVIVTPGLLQTLAAKQATSSIPIVLVGVGDPVGAGLVASLARPGGNITGLSANATELSAKRLQLLKEAVPTLSRVAVLWNSTMSTMTLRFREVQAAAPTLGLAVQSFQVEGPSDFESAFSAMTRAHPDGLIVFVSSIGPRDLSRIVAFAAKHRLPTMYEFRQHAEAGGLMSYGVNYAELARQAAAYIDKILKGRKPADLPVQEPTRLELVVNLQTAKALGLTIPQSVLIRADEVIQ